MSDAANRAFEQARFAAREFVARFAREMGCEPSAVVTDRMLFAYEMGYLRGRGDEAREIMQLKMIDDTSQSEAREAAKMIGEASQSEARETTKMIDEASQSRDALDDDE